MKNILGVILIVALLGISVLGFIDNRDNKEPVLAEVADVEVEEITDYGDIRIESDTRVGTVVDVEDLDKVLKYLDPHEKQNYQDLLTVYASYLPLCATDKPSDFFSSNIKLIGNYLGLYSIEEFTSLNDLLKSKDITPSSKVSKVQLVNIHQSGAFLEATVRIFYDKAYITMSHVLDYLYVGNEAYLFLYHKGGMVE